MAKVLNNQQLLDRRTKGLSFDGAKPAAPVGAVQGLGTGTSDSNLAALSHGEYVLPEATTKAVGKENLDELVRGTTGQEPGGKPVAPMHKGLTGFAGGGMWNGVQLDPFEGQSLSKYAFDGSGTALDDSVSRQVSRAANGMPQSDEVWEAARPQLEDKLARQSRARGLGIPGLLGFAGGGMIDDLYGETYEKRNALRTYTPEPGNIPERAPSRAPELRNYNPQADGAVRARLSPAVSGETYSPVERAGRPYTPDFQMRGGASQPGTSLVPYEAPKATQAPAVEPSAPKAPSMGERVAGARQGVQDVRAARAAQPPAPKAGFVRGLAGGVAATAPLAGFGDYKVVGDDADSSAGGVVGNVMDGNFGQAWQGVKKGAVEAGLDSIGGLAKTADWVGGLVGAQPGLERSFESRVKRDLGDLVETPSDRAPATAATPAPAPQMTDKERSDEIANRRAAIEQPGVRRPALPNPYDRVVDDVNRVYDGRPRGLSAQPQNAPQPAGQQPAQRTGAAPDWLHAASVQAESGGRRYGADGRLLESPKGAKGERQVLDSTNLDPGFGVAPARDNSPEERARVGRDYLDAMHRRYGGNTTATLAAYNWGPGNVDKWLAAGGDFSKLPAETQKYVQRISASQPTQLAAADTGTMTDAPRGLSAQAEAPAPAPQQQAAGDEPFEMVPLRSLQGNIVGYDVVSGAENIRRRLAQEELRTAPGSVIAAGRGEEYLGARAQGAVNDANPLDAKTDAEIRKIGAEALFNPGGKNGKGKGKDGDGSGSAKDDLQLYNETVDSVRGALGLPADDAGKMAAEREVRRIQDERAILRSQLEQAKAAGQPYNEGMLEQLSGPLSEDERGMWTAALTAERQGQRGLDTVGEYSRNGAVVGGLGAVLANMWAGAKQGAKNGKGGIRGRALSAAGGAVGGAFLGAGIGGTNAPKGFENENLRQYVVDDAGNPVRMGRSGGNVVWEGGGYMPEATFDGQLGLQKWNPFFKPDPDAARAERIIRGGR